MISRSLWHRIDRRGTVRSRPGPSRAVPDRSALVRVALEDFTTGITQSFLIKPGETAQVTLTGYVNTDHGPRVLVVPLKLRAALS